MSVDNVTAVAPASSRRPWAVRGSVLAVAAAAGVVLLAGPASAHVSVQPQGEAAQGGYATVNFKVPNERDDASTVKLEINFPADHPLTSVMPQPVPGWDVKVTKEKLDKPLESHGNKITEAVSKVTWTAEKDGVAPGTFQQFPVSSGRCPTTPTSSSSRPSRRTTARRSCAGSRSRRKARSRSPRRRCWP